MLQFYVFQSQYKMMYQLLIINYSALLYETNKGGTTVRECYKPPPDGGGD
jgi:hypothetical protein